MFARRQRYRVPVWASRHPGLNAYIDDVIAAAKTQIQKNIVRSIHMVISSVTTERVLERYRFDVDFILANVALRDRDFSIPGNMTMETMELQLRAFMMKLISLDGALYDFEDVEDLTWSLVLDMKEGCEPQSSDSKGNEPSQGPWVPYREGDGGKMTVGKQSGDGSSDGERPNYLRANPAWPKSSNGSDGTDQLDDAQIVPIKSLDTGVINLMLYVEEHPSAKRSSKGNVTSRSGGEGLRRKLNSSTANVKESELAAQIGERDIDQPLMQPSSAGAAARKGSSVVKKKKPTDGAETNAEGQSEASEHSNSDAGSDSGDSIRSVNDFAGYGKGPGGVGMSGVGM